MGMSEKDEAAWVAATESVESKTILITVDEDGCPAMETTDLAEWEIVGLARWLLMMADNMLEDVADEAEDE